MHAVKDGPANRSFGLHVAAIAGLPKPVIEQARGYLAALEQNRAEMPVATKASPTNQLPLFANKPSAIDEALRGVDPDSLTPREALDLLYKLKKLQ